MQTYWLGRAGYAPGAHRSCPATGHSTKRCSSQSSKVAPVFLTSLILSPAGADHTACSLRYLWGTVSSLQQKEKGRPAPLAFTFLLTACSSWQPWRGSGITDVACQTGSRSAPAATVLLFFPIFMYLLACFFSDKHWLKPQPKSFHLVAGSNESEAPAPS